MSVHPSLSLVSLRKPGGVDIALSRRLSAWFHQVGDMTLIPLESAEAARKRLKSQATWLYRFKRDSLYPRHHLYMSLDLKVDQRVAVFRLQLRLKCARINSFLFKINSVISPHCPWCSNPVVEDIEHLLLDCPRYSAPRSALAVAFQGLKIILSVNSILLSNLVVSRPLLPAAIQYSGRFLLAVYRLRFCARR
jgi:hypothetical protein